MRDKSLKSYTGDLSMTTLMNPILRRNVCEAMLFDDNGWKPIAPIIDTQIIVMGADVMILRGTEYHQTRRGMVEYVQEWVVRQASNGD